MKIAVIDQNGIIGGIARYTRSLLIAMKRLRPELEIIFFVHIHHPAQKEMIAEFLSHGIKTKKLKAGFLRRVKRGQRLIRSFQNQFTSHLKYLPIALSGASDREVEKISKGFDLVFFNYWHHMRCPKLSCPMIAIFHDFNFRYNFSGHPIFSHQEIKSLFKETPVWLERCSAAIVSTNFMFNELKKFYPESAPKAKVVHIGPFSSLTDLSFEKAREIVDRFGIAENYILYPANCNSHKNLSSLLHAVALIKKRHPDIALVLTGVGTSFFNGHLCELGIEIYQYPQDVFGLDYVSNLQMDALVICAKLVISTSLYEAGNGPGLDAWEKGVPVAMSNIPPFLEHMDVQGVKAEVFDPRSPRDIADKIETILTNPLKAKADALHSQKMLKKFDWTAAAQKYLEIFDATIKNAGMV